MPRHQSAEPVKNQLTLDFFSIAFFAASSRFMCHNVLGFNRKDGRCILDLIAYAHPACHGDVSRRPRAAEVAADGFAPKPRPFFSLPHG